MSVNAKVTRAAAAEMLVRDNGMLTDRLTVGGDRVHLSDIRVPFLTVRANRDHIVPPDATAPLIGLVGSADKHELCLDAGHFHPLADPGGVAAALLGVLARM